VDGPYTCFTMKCSISENRPDGWNSLSEACSWGSFYHSARNLDLVQAVAAVRVYYLSCYKNGQLTGGISFGVKNGISGPVVNCLPYFGSYGDALVERDGDTEAEKLLYRSLLQHCHEMNALSLTVISSPFAGKSHHGRLLQFLRPSFTENRICQISHIPAYNGEARDTYRDKILGMMQGRARTAYKKVARAGFELRRAESESEVLAFASIHQQNIGAKGGIFKTKEFFLKVFRMSQDDANGSEMAVVLDNGNVVAGVVLFSFKDMVEYHSVCLSDSYRSISPIYQIIVERMVDAGMAGCRLWNFGGTWNSQVGVYKFKRSFGALDYPYHYYNVFFRDLEAVRQMRQKDIIRAYPLYYVVPFSEVISDG
jgi:Acetyltransferase (GNAT) domain